MLDIFFLSLLNGIIFAIYCYLVSYILLQKKQTNIKTIIKSFIPFFGMYYCVLCLLDSIYAAFFSGLCAFFLIRMVFKENMFMSLFISLIIHTAKILNKVLILSILNDEKLLLFNTYKSLDWTALYINLGALVLSAIVIFIFRNPLRKVIKVIPGLKNRKHALLIAIYLNLILVIIYQPPNNLFLQ